MRDSLMGGRIRMDADGAAQAQAQQAAHPVHDHGPDRAAFHSASSAGSAARHVGRAMSMMFSRGDEVRPYQSCADHVKEFIPMPILCLIVGCIIGTTFLAVVVQPEFELVANGTPCVAAGPLGANCSLKSGASASGDCIFGLTMPIQNLTKCPTEVTDFRTAAPKWKAYFVMNAIILAIGAIAMGSPVAPTILVTNVAFVYTKIMTEKEAFAGFGSPSIVALAILFVLSSAIERSGMLEPLIDRLMGDGNSPHMSRVRLIIAVCFMSGFVSNTPLCAMLMPFVINWAERRGLEPCDFLLPLAMATNIGGTFTQIGSPPNLVVFDRVHTAGLPMGMFYQSPLSVLCFAVFGLYNYFLGPYMLKSSVRPQSLGQAAKSEDQLYTIRWVVMDDSELVGSTWRERGLARLSSTTLKRIFRHGDQVARGPGETEADKASDIEFHPGDEIIAVSDARDIARLRHVRGLLISGDAGEALRRLGADRRKRCLFECVFRPGMSAAKLAPGVENMDLRSALLSSLKAGLISFRGSIEEGAKEPPKGRIALVEADEDGFEAKVDKAFSLVRKIPGTTPPRTGRHADPVRAWLATAIVFIVIGMCILVSVPSLGLGEVWLSTAPLASMSIIAAALIVAIDILTLKEALNSINVQAYIGIAASLGLGKALENTGVARMIAASLVSAAKSAGCGLIGISAAMFVGGCMLSNVVTNTAVAVLVMPIAETISAEEGIDVRVLGALVILASNFALATPFACASNLMVMAPRGPTKPSYSFGDYVRYGVPLQICLVITAIIGVSVLYDTAEPTIAVALRQRTAARGAALRAFGSRRPGAPEGEHRARGPARRRARASAVVGSP
eukprot:CAMPEP_0176069360 /NCGR_PEP_ID=MMETSP0120_2-20121206/34629_1 /TAXON_ID=160619 /ORGANISM="Kryptoperidinium foliaceum, Strain CCMP 1326" /LENGTH=844 /DNA_ID=CAMNT_0017402991 /DNA_START=1 /DNA_END=2530 /DNA_ORIENTATION=-